MPSQDSFFKVKTGLGVGTNTFYASVSDKRITVGATTGDYEFNVYGETYVDENLYVDSKVGIGTTIPRQTLDVRGVGIVSDRVGIGTTNPLERIQVGSNKNEYFVVSYGGSVGIGLTNPTQKFQFSGVSPTTDIVVIDAEGFIGVGIEEPLQPFHYDGRDVAGIGGTVVISGFGSIGVGILYPQYDVDIAQNLRVVGYATITDAFIGVATVGLATITNEFVGVSTVGLATIRNAYIGIATVGLATITNEFVGFSTVGITTIENAFIGITTVGLATIRNAYIGIATVGLATITNEFVGVSTVGLATISNAYIGVATVGLATITNEFVGVSTVGLATIRNAYIGIATVGLATITNEFVGVATIGLSTTRNAYIGVATVGLATITNEFVGVSTINSLFVTGITTTVNLDVGIGGTIITATASFATEDVYQTDGVTYVKTIEPLVGVGTDIPTRTLDVAGDLRIRGEILDSSNNVGFAYSVLGATALGVSGRFIDAANILIRNKDFIAAEVVGFVTHTDGPFGANGVDFDYGPIGVDAGREKCKRDVGLIIDSIAFDISRGGNSKSVGAGLSYYNGVVLSYLDDSSPLPAGFSAGYVKQATLAGISTIAYLAQHVINNVPVPDLHQFGEGFGKRVDAAGLIEKNIDFIAELAVDRTLNNFPSFIIPGGNENCITDIKTILTRLVFNLKYGGNDQVWDAANFYVQNDVLQDEETESIYAFMQARDMAIQAMRNQTINTSLYTGTKVQVKDLSITIDLAYPAGSECADIASAIASYVGIVTNTINNSSFLNTINKTSSNSGYTQLIDLELLPDGDSNSNIDGCANVVSAIYSCVGIITTIIDQGPSASPNVNEPAAQVTWQSPGPRVGNEWFVNKYGSDENTGEGPGSAFLTIKKACSIAQPGDTVKVYAGLYIEDGPIQVPERVAVVGEDLRRTLVTTRDKTDLYHVRRGCYISQQSFIGPSNPGKAMVSFPTMGSGYADGTEQNWQSPYVQNCTNFVPDSIGMRIDGDRAGGFKSMVLDAYTQYNQGGIGVSISNFGYAQLVSLFTICCDTAVFCDTGGVCDLNNSNCSFGNFALVSNGATPLQYTGTVTVAPDGDNVDSLVLNVGAGASQSFIDTAELLRLNKDFIASEAVGFLTSTDGPYGIGGTYFDYGGSIVGRDKCRRDAKIIVESLASDILTLGNLNSINAGKAYRDSEDGSITYLPESSPPPGTLSVGYVKQGEIAFIQHIAGIATYIAQNVGIPTSYQSGIGTFTQVFDFSKTYSPIAKSYINRSAGIITSIIGIGLSAVPEKILPKGQRPYDGQIAYIDTQYYFVSSIVVDNPGFGYDPTIPVEVTIDLPDNEEFFIPAEAAIFENNISTDGRILGVDILVSGTGYGSTAPTVTIAPPPNIGPGVGTTATARAVMEKLFFNPVASTPVSAGGTTTVTFDEFITYPVSAGTTVYFYQSSKIIASSITFEYVGTGINIVNAIPSKGAVPITENQIVATNGGKVPFTSTDQGGNFRISEGITINQNTGTISGQAFSKSLQAEVTPLIIALQS
jgi:hypothetical protein